MFRVLRLRVESETEQGLFGFDYTFRTGLNFIASFENTSGKSSVLIALYYALGLEELIGAKGSTVLTPVYKIDLTYNNEEHIVLQSEIYLELTNGIETITISRVGKKEGISDNLVSVYHSSMNDIDSPKTEQYDYYLGINSTKNKDGFHNFLEKFLNIELPLVVSNDGNERKLYLQLLFAAMFIEQKRGWSDLFSGLPYLGIKEPKQRVVEFILNMQVINNERKRKLVQIEKTSIVNKWKVLIDEIFVLANRENCTVYGIPNYPQVLSEKLDKKYSITVIDLFGVIHEFDDFVKQSEFLLDKSNSVELIVGDNFEELNKELSGIENDIDVIEKEITDVESTYNRNNVTLSILKENLEVISNDIINNKDAMKLAKLGSELEINTYNNKCPVCNQHINDSLLTIDIIETPMTLEENIRHLESQKALFSYSLNSIKGKQNELRSYINAKNDGLYELRRLAISIRSDLRSIKSSLSETEIRKKIILENKISNLAKMKSEIERKLDLLYKASEEWRDVLIQEEKIPKDGFTSRDQLVLKDFTKNFLRNLEKYKYKSKFVLTDISISRQTYLPVAKDFDVKFSSSASDNIRSIWAYTVALLNTSIAYNGNHPGVLIFDEPAQHSIVFEDLNAFYSDLMKVDNAQVIVGLTMNSEELKDQMFEYNRAGVNVIFIQKKSFERLEKSIHSA